MMISHRLKAIFIHNHRTGGTTIGNLLRQQTRNQVDEISQHGNVRGTELALLDLHSDYFVFGFVRNPWDRLRSWFDRLYNAHNNGLVDVTKKEAFEVFLSNLIEADGLDVDFHLNQLDYFTDQNGVLRVDKIGRFETFERDVAEIFGCLGRELTDIPRLNSTPSKSYRDYYTPDAKAIVTEKCRGDIAAFGYKF